MRSLLLLKACLLLACLAGAVAADAGEPDDLTHYVLPEMGTANTPEVSNGNLYPSVNAPWGMHAWSPVTKPGTDERWFYDYTGSRFYGFRSVRQPSPWIGDYCAWTILPVLGDPQERADDRCSWFGHKSETIRPHYYSVFLPDYDLTAEIVPTVRAALLRVTLGEAGRPGFVVNPFPGGKVSLSDDGRSVCGRSVQTTNRRCQPAGMKNDFVVSLDRAASESRVLPDGALYVGFPEAAKGTRLTVGIASSFISPEQAALNLRELGDRDFKRLEREGRDAWNEVLGKVRVESDSDARKQVFYTCLYRALIFPRTLWEVDARGEIVHWSPETGKVHPGYYYGGTGFWDTFRALYPLLNFLYPHTAAKMMAGLANCWKECGWLPEWSAPGLTNCMIGNHSASVVADAWLSGVRGPYDIKALYAALLHGANACHPTIPAVGRLGFELYNEKGYVPRDAGIRNSASRTLEYAYDDWCIARLGQALGRPRDEWEAYARRARNWRNVFDSTRKIVVGRNADGSFAKDFDPCLWGYDFCEGCAHHWTWSVFHDVPGLMSAMGGKAEFERRLDEIFELPPRGVSLHKNGIEHEMREMQLGGLGQYAHGNQPIQHMIYLYAWTDSPWKAGLRARQAMDRLYRPTPDGYCGDEDNGQTSAWYVWSALGFYPVCPGSGEVAVGAPAFERIKVELPGRKQLELRASGVAQGPKCVSSVTLNGKGHAVDRFRLDELRAGGRIDFAFALPDDTAAIQARIDAVSAHGGGTVRLEKGTHSVHGLFLRDNVTLELAEGAVLQGALDWNDYNHCPHIDRLRAVVIGCSVTNVAITGKGTIDGRGWSSRTVNNTENRWMDVYFHHVTNVRVEGVSLVNPAFWTCRFLECDRVTVRGVRIDSHANYNGDGIDIEASNVLVEDCDLDCQDDAICFKSGNPAFSVENGEVRNCRISSNSNFIKFGTPGAGVYRNIRIHDCEVSYKHPTALTKWSEKRGWAGIKDDRTGISAIALEVVDGGVMEDITVSDITIGEGCQVPIFIRQGRRAPARIAGRESRLQNIVIERVRATKPAASAVACSITGVPGLRPRNIVLRDMELVFPGGGTAADVRYDVPEVEERYPECHMFGRLLPAWAFYLRHVDNVRFENVTVRLAGPDARDCAYAEDTTDVVTKNCNFSVTKMKGSEK